MTHDDVTITKVPPRPVIRARYDELTKLYRRVPDVDEVQEPTVHKLTMWDTVKLIPFAFQILQGVVMNNPKTTIAGLVAAAAMIVKAIWGFEIPALITDSIIALAVFFIGKYAADASKQD